MTSWRYGMKVALQGKITHAQDEEPPHRLSAVTELLKDAADPLCPVSILSRNTPFLYKLYDHFSCC